MIAHGKQFKDTTIFLDGVTLVECKLDSCTLVYAGTLPLKLEGNTLKDCRWSFSGPAAATIGFMTALYQMGGSAKDAVEATFNNIRKGDAGTRRPGDPIVLN